MENPNAAVVQQNSTILSNVAALTGCILTSIGERDISKTLHGETLSRDQIEHLVLAKVTASIITEANA